MSHPDLDAAAQTRLREFFGGQAVAPEAIDGEPAPAASTALGGRRARITHRLREVSHLFGIRLATKQPHFKKGQICQAPQRLPLALHREFCIWESPHTNPRLTPLDDVEKVLGDYGHQFHRGVVRHLPIKPLDKASFVLRKQH